MPRHFAPVHQHAIRAVEILDDDLAGPLEEHCMVTAYRLGIDLQLATRRPANAGTAPQGIGGARLALDLHQLRQEFPRQRRRSGGAESLDAGLQAAEHVGVVVRASFEAADEKLPFLESPACALEGRTQRAVLLGELIDARALERKLVI